MYPASTAQQMHTTAARAGCKGFMLSGAGVPEGTDTAAAANQNINDAFRIART